MLKPKKGAPTKLTPKLRDEIVAAVRDVLVLRQVAGLCKITVQSIYNWINQGLEDINNDLSTEYVHFFYALKVAQAQEVQSLIKEVKKRETGWQAFAWLLERCFREDFGQDNEKMKELLDKQQHFEKLLDQIMSSPIQGRRVDYGKEMDSKSD